jgi:CMP-2-keto-3-deoxyoctulosonic acid synthetase
VKVVFDKFGKALYFSRAPIPAFRNEADFDVALCFKHIGIYTHSHIVLPFASLNWLNCLPLV